MNTDTPTARCPKCHRPTATPHAGNNKTWFCFHCAMPFEDEDDGLIGYRRPEANAMMRERHLPKTQRRSR
jgi:ribosomal protein L37AE/L43A